MAAARAEATQALGVAKSAIQARKEAVVAMEAARAATRGGSAAPPLAGAAATGADDANMEQVPWQVASAAGGSDEAEDPEHVPDAEHIIHAVTADLAALEDYTGPDLTTGRNTCACGLPATLFV